jgi:hypothetical protein
LVLLSSSIGALFAMPFTGWLIIRNGSRQQDQSEYTVVDSKLILNAGQPRKVIRVNETVQEEDNFYGKARRRHRRDNFFER